MMKRFPAMCALVLGAAACAGDPPVVVKPELLPAPSPFRYPVSQWDQRVEGETMLLLHVSDSGQVDSTMIHASSGNGGLDTAAIIGAKRLRFTPRKRDDRYVGMWTKLPVRFAIDSAAAAAADETKSQDSTGTGTAGDSAR